MVNDGKMYCDGCGKEMLHYGLEGGVLNEETDLVETAYEFCSTSCLNDYERLAFHKIEYVRWQDVLSARVKLGLIWKAP